MYHLKVNNLYVNLFKNAFDLIYLLTNIATIYTQLNDFIYCYQTLIVLSNTIHLFAYCELVTGMSF